MSILTNLQRAALLGQLDTLRDIWYHNPDSFNDTLDKYGRSLLMYSLLGGQLECAKFLHLCGQSLNHVAKNQFSVLHCAVMGNCVQCCQWLVEDHSFDIYIQDKIGRTALHYACLNGFQLIINYLMDCHRRTLQPNPDSLFGKSKNGDTILHLLARGGHTSTLSQLLSNSEIASLLDHQNRLGHSALHVACQYGHLPSIICLLRAGVDYSLPSMSGETPRDIVEKEGYHEVLNIITSIATQKYHLNEDDESKSEPHVPETPEHVKEALKILQQMNELKNSEVTSKPLFDQEKSPSRLSLPSSSPRHSSQSSTLMASAAYKMSGNQSIRNDSSNMIPRLSHRSSNNGDKPEKRFVISDFDDDTSSISDQGDDSRRNSVNGYDLDSDF